MENATHEQVRRFRLHRHHLDTWYGKADIEPATGACGLQNSPPGAWQAALQNRIEGLDTGALRQMLEEDKALLQAWSFRGAPVVFPTAESDVFLRALIPKPGEAWIYTNGIQLALDFLGLGFDELLPLLVQVIPGLDGVVLKSKTTLDQTLAEWVLPHLPPEKRDLWNAPSMYGAPDRQTVGGAVVSFLLRPCAFMGLVVFGRRQGTSPTFTSYKGWVGGTAQKTADPERELVRKYLRCYGPATTTGFAGWLGCTPAQGQRLWDAVADELAPVAVEGKQRYLLAVDRPLLADPPRPERTLHLLAGHDPYLGLPDRESILADKALQRQLWQTVANPGAVLWHGAVAGTWKGLKKGAKIQVEVTLWDESAPRAGIQELAALYAQQQGRQLGGVTFHTAE